MCKGVGIRVLSGWELSGIYSIRAVGWHCPAGSQDPTRTFDFICNCPCTGAKPALDSFIPSLHLEF